MKQALAATPFVLLAIIVVLAARALLGRRGA